MPQTCTVCRQPNVAEIERAIVGGEPLRDIARQYGVSKDAVARHKSDHLPRTLVKTFGRSNKTPSGKTTGTVYWKQSRPEPGSSASNSNWLIYLGGPLANSAGPRQFSRIYWCRF
jgi:hypothetical protein